MINVKDGRENKSSQQCDQMLDWKVAQLCPKVAQLCPKFTQKVNTADFLKNQKFFKIARRSCQMFGLSKLANLVTLLRSYVNTYLTAEINISN